jgi:hypothetical protein
MEEESRISALEGAESFDWTATQTDNAASSDFAENGTELLSTNSSVSEYTTSAFVIEPIAIDSSATDDISTARISNGHLAADDGLSSKANYSYCNYRFLMVFGNAKWKTGDTVLLCVSLPMCRCLIF